MLVWKIGLSAENEPEPTRITTPDGETDAQEHSAPKLIVLKREDRQGREIDEPTHCHTFVEVEYIAGGTCTQIINGQEYQAKRGDVLFFNIGDKHAYHASSDIQLVNCMFYYDLIQDIAMSENTGYAQFLPNVIHLSGEYTLEVEAIFQKMEQEYAHRAYGYNTILKSYVTIMISLLLRFTTQNLFPVDENASAILEYLDRHYAACNLNDVASRFNYSPSYFSRYFKRNVGISFSQYIRNKRIKEAIRLLTTTNMTNESICAQIGFSSKNQFYKLLQEYTGKTPLSIRREAQSRQAEFSESDGSAHWIPGANPSSAE